MKRKNDIFRSKRIGSCTSVTLSLFLMLVITACGTGNTGTPEDRYQRLTEMVNSHEFEIEHEWVIPLGGQQITLIGNPNYVRFEGDSVDIYLPYFGVRHAGGGYSNTDGGIEFQGVPENLEIIEQDQKRSVVLKFRGDQGSEDLQFLITIFQNGRAETRVNSSQRQSISYRGEVTEGLQPVRE